MSFDQKLTSREKDICGLIAKGFSSRQIADFLFLSEGTVKNYITSIYDKAGVQNRVQLTAVYVSKYSGVMTDIPGPFRDDGASHRFADAAPDAVLRLVGLSSLPGEIPIAFSGRPFVIGRFDASIGQKQCDFEFGKSTLAVSRRHASIERTPSGYEITDLNSRAGTFVNGKRIVPGEPQPLHPGDRVSFGYAGADYILGSG